MKTKFSTRILAFVLIIALVVPTLVFNVSAEDTVIEFTLGANGSASHNDGGSATTYSQTVDGYKLNITNGTKMYTGARDAKGNSCLKFGTSSATGSCQFTVPDDVTAVKIFVGKYKANTTKVSVNGTSYTISNASNNGQYDTITVDTTTNKTVKFATVSGGVRAMINTIQFIVPASGEPSISLAGDNIMQVGKNVTLTATLNNFEGDVEWTSDDEDIATVVNGVVTGVSMGKTTITATSGAVSQSMDITVYPAEGAITIAEAIEIAKFAGDSASPYTYIMTGVIEKIDSQYSEQYGNISVTIADDTGSIYVYRMNGGADLIAGQTIAVTGKLMTYSGDPQVSQYSEFELIVDDSTEALLEAIAALELKMSLAYRYEASVEEVPVTNDVEDIINSTFNGVTSGTTYKEWTDKIGTSGASYTGFGAADSGTVQIRTSDSKSGIISKVSGGRIKSITITWNTKTSDGRKLDIYGSNTAYSATTDLFNTTNQGEKITSFTYTSGGATTATFEVTGDYAYIGIRSNDGALYLDSISIVWEQASEDGETKEELVYSNSQFAFKFAIDSEIANIAGDNTYGIMVSAEGGKTAYFDTLLSEDGTLCYVVVNLGDIIGDLTKLNTKFTIRGYIEVDGAKYFAETTKSYSVVSIIAYYCDNLGITEVEHLYDYLANSGLI